MLSFFIGMSLMFGSSIGQAAVCLIQHDRLICSASSIWRESSQRISRCAAFAQFLVTGLKLGHHFLHGPAGPAIDPLLNVGAERFQYSVISLVIS